MKITNIQQILIQLKKEKKLNKEMMALVSNLENTQNGSEILIDDSKDNYNLQWTKNLEMFLCIGLISIMLKKFFTPIPIK